MKIKNAALSLAGCAIIALGVGELGVLAQENKSQKDIGFDPINAVQHIDSIKIIASDGGSGILTNAGNNLVGISAKNFIISQTGEKINTINGAADASNILGGSNNNITKGVANTILGGAGNTNQGSYSTVLGGRNNTILNGDYSTIVGGSDNTLNGNGSVIVGGNSNNLEGNYSAVLGNGAGVVGNNSVALGNNSRINNANNSFLWTDGDNRPELTKSNVFVINSEHGMVVNGTAAHNFAKLTIGGPLVLYAGEDVKCDDKHKGVLKVVDGTSETSSRKCFCSCDGGDYWHSLYGQGRCEGVCNGTNKKTPACDKSALKIDHTNHSITGGCSNSSPVIGDGAYFVDYNGIVYWTCQTDDGELLPCNNK